MAAKVSIEMTVDLTYETEATWFSSSKMASKQIKIPCEFKWELPRKEDVSVVEGENSGSETTMIMKEQPPVRGLNRRSWDHVEQEIELEADQYNLKPVLPMRYFVYGDTPEYIDPDAVYPLSCIKKYRPAGETAMTILSVAFQCVNSVKHNKNWAECFPVL